MRFLMLLTILPWFVQRKIAHALAALAWKTLKVGNRSAMHYCESTRLLSWDPIRNPGFHGDSNYDSEVFLSGDATGEEYGLVQYADSGTDENGFAKYIYDVSEEIPKTKELYIVRTKYRQLCVNNIAVPSSFWEK